MPQRRQAFPEDLPPLPDIDSADDGLPPLPDIEPAPIPKRQEPQRPVAATPAKQVQVRDLVQIPEPDPRRDLRMPATPDPAGWRTTPMPWETKAAKLEQRPMPVPPMARPGAMREMKVPGAVARVVDPTLSAFGRGLSGVASDLGGAARAIAEKAPIKTPRMRALEGIGELVAEHADLPQPKWIGQTEARKSPALASAASALDTAAKSLSRNPTAKAPQWVHDLAANPTRLHDPSYVVNLAFEGMGSSAAFLAGGLAAGARAAASLPTEAWRKAAKWAVGSTTGALLESAADAGGAFNEEIARGTDPKVAAQVFTEIMKREVPVTVATNALGEFVPTGGMGRGRRLLQEALTVGVEGIEEPAQGVAQRSAQRDVTGRPMDIWDPVLEEFVGGALGRVGVGSASAAASAIKERMAPAPQGRQDQAFDVNEEKPKLETGAVVDPLDDIALPPIPDEAADTSEPWQRANAQAAREDLGLPELPDEPIEITAKTEDAPTKRIVPEPTGDAPVRPDAVDVASQPQPTAQPAKPAARFESRSATDAGGPTVEDSAFDELVESRLRDVIPDKAERDAFTVKVTETDYNPEWRAAAHNDAFDAVFGKRSIKFTKDNRETEFERVANLAMEKAREEFPEEGTFAEVSLDYVSRPSTSGPYPTEQGIALRLVDNPAGYQYPSQRVFDRASEIYTAITGGEGPSIPKPRLETKRQGGLGGSTEGESIGQRMLPPSSEKADLTPDEKGLLDEMFSRGRARDNEDVISSDLFIEDFNRGNAALIGLIEKGLVERSTGGGPVKYTRSIGKPSIDTVEAIRSIQGNADAPVSIAKLREAGVTDEQLLRSADRESVQLWESHLNAGHPDVKANPRDFLIHEGRAYNAAYYPQPPSAAQPAKSAARLADTLTKLQDGADAPVPIGKLRDAGVTDDQILEAWSPNGIALWESHLNAGHPDVKANPKDFLIHEGKAYNVAVHHPDARRETQIPTPTASQSASVDAPVKPKPSRGSRVAAKTEKYTADNLEAARSIMANPDRYAGGMLEWAANVIAKSEGATPAAKPAANNDDYGWADIDPDESRPAPETPVKSDVSKIAPRQTPEAVIAQAIQRMRPSDPTGRIAIADIKDAVGEEMAGHVDEVLFSLQRRGEVSLQVRANSVELLRDPRLEDGATYIGGNPRHDIIVTPAFKPPAPATASAQPSMPKGLAAAKPRYGYGKKQFTLSFENVADMAAYIASSPRPSKHHQEYLQYAMGALGTDADGVKAHGARLRESIKGMAKVSEPGNLAVPSSGKDRKFEVAQVRSGRDAVPTPEGLRAAFPDWTWTQDPQGFLWAKTPHGGRIRVDLREGNIKASVAEIERQLGRQRKRGELVTGEFVSGEDLIVLSKHADYGTFHYETFRWAWKNLLRPVEREALLERYGTETNAAIAFRDMGGSRTESGVLATLRGWLDRIAEAILSHSPDRIMRRLARRNRSSIWERAAMQVNLNAEDRIRTIRDVLSRQNYGRLRYLRHDAQEALLKGTPGVGSVDAKVRIVQMAPRIDEMLKGVGGWAAFRDYAIDSRLAGVQDRWWKLRSAVLELTDDDMRGQIEGEDAPIGTLLDLIADLERNRAPQGTVVSQARSRVIGILNKDGPAAAREYIGKYFAHLALAIKRKDLLTAHGHTLKEYLALPEVQQSLDLYREYLGDAVEASHVANEGFLSEALGPMGVWYPLVPVKSLEEEKAMVTLHGRDEWLKPINPTNFFTFGLAPEYDSSMEAFTKAVGKALESNNRAAAMDALVKVGLAKRVRNPSKRGVGNFFGENMDAVGYSAPSLRTVKVKGQKLRVPMEHYIIPAVLERELAPLVEERPYGKHWATDATSAATRFALLGPFDNRYHLSMQISAMDNGLPWLPSTGRIPGFVRNIPLVKTLFGMRDIYNVATKEINSEDGEAFMREMAQVGAVSPRANTSTVDPERAKLLGIEFTPSPIQRQYWTESAELTPEHLKASRESRLGAIHIAGETAGPALAKAGHTFREKVEGLYGPLTYGTNGIDNAARFALWKWHKENFPDAPLIDRIHFVNQVGNYTWGMMGSMERTLKAMPGGPFLATFATAGLTNLRNGLRYALGWAPGVSPHPGIPMDQLDFKQRMKLKMASSVTGGLLMATMLWVLVSKYTSGEWPWEDEKSVPFRARFSPQFLRENPNIAKMVEAVAGKDPSLEKYFDLGFASPALVRGARAIGAMETWKQWQHGKRGKYGKPQYSASQVAWEAARDAGNTLVTPFLSGPAFQLSTSLFGIRPYVTSMYDRSGNFGPQIYARQIQADDPFAWIGKSAFNAAAQSNDLFGAAGEGLYTAATGYDITPHSRRDYGSAPLQAALQMVMPRFGPVAYNAAYYQNTAQQATRRIKQQAKKAAAEAEKRRRDRGR